jgi:hypothetical protein
MTGTADNRNMRERAPPLVAPSPLVTAKRVGPLRSLRRALRWVRAQLAVRPAVNRGVLGVLTPGHFRPPMGCIFTAAAGGPTCR